MVLNRTRHMHSRKVLGKDTSNVCLCVWCAFAPGDLSLKSDVIVALWHCQLQDCNAVHLTVFQEQDS